MEGAREMARESLSSREGKRKWRGEEVKGGKSEGVGESESKREKKGSE